jgi:hypothetical protein
MGGQEGRWAAKREDGRLRGETGGLQGRWVAKLVTRLLAMTPLWVRIQTPNRKLVCLPTL